MTHFTFNQSRLMMFAFIFLATFFFNAARAQDSTTKQATTFYTFVFNEVPENFKFPVVGLVNMASGNQKGVQIGFTNINQKNLQGTQIGFTNAVGGATKGSQIGFVNACRDSFKGSQIGYVNVVANKVNGAQIGFVNASKNAVRGTQVSFINVASDKVKGAQVGFVNVCAGNIDGAQVGFINGALKETKGGQVGFVNLTNKKLTGSQVGYVNVAVKEAKGTQVGFVNVANKPLTGSQVGFINVADSIGHGIPLGFLSIVRKGGYYALEASTTELYPANLSFKIGVKALYTTFNASYNPDFKREFAIGMGLGSIFQLSKRFYFNPEAVIQNTLHRENQQFLSLSTLAGYSFSNHWSLVAGPSVTWSHLYNDDNSYKETEFYKPSFSLYENTLDARNRIHVGARFALRYNF